MPDEFFCENCGVECDDTSYQPLCPDCYWDEEGDECCGDPDCDTTCEDCRDEECC